MTRLPARVAVAAALFVLGACSHAGDRPRHVVLISLDTVRADRLGCYGHPDAGTPHFDALAARGVRCDQAMTPMPLTLPAHASLLTSHLPLRHGVRHNELHGLPDGAVTLAEILQAAGWRTGAFVGSAVLAPIHGLGQGFSVYSDVPASATKSFLMTERSALDVNRDALAWLDSAGGAPTLLFVHYMEAHAPYEPPDPERSRFGSDPYQGEIATLDRALGELLAGLDERGIGQDALVIVVADHGEGLGEHGELSHGALLYESTLRVPMIFAGPGVRAAGIVADPVSLVDVMPTILEAVGLPARSDADGLSLWPALAGREKSRAGRSLYAETFMGRLDFGWAELRAVRRDELKYIGAPRPELYDIRADPGERTNLHAGQAAAAADLGRELARLVTAERDAMAPAQVQLTEAEREALQALGYLSAAHAGTTQASRPDPKDRIQDLAALQRGVGFAGAGKVEEAEHELRALLATRPDMVDARLNLINLLRKAGRNADALTLAREGVEDAARTPGGEGLASRLHLSVAGIHFQEGRLPEAAAELELALRGPQAPQTHLTLAVLYEDLGRPDEALRVLKRMESLRLDTADSIAMRAMLEKSAGSPVIH